MTEPGQHLDAPAIASAVSRGELSASDVVARSVQAALAAQDHINAFTLIDAERASERAMGIDAKVAAGADPGPLAGVPVAVKDIVDHEGRVTTCGADFPAEPAIATAPCLARLEAAGAVIIGRTGLHEFAFGFSSENHWFGPVRNPWDADLSPGGSSGGSGAAVGASIVPFALGTDTGGSVRVPAALCGAVGLKVTHGRGSLRGVFPLASSLDTVGPIGRTVADVAAAYAVIGAHDAEDPWSAPRPVVVPGPPVPLPSLTVGVPHPWVDRGLDEDVAVAFEAALGALADHGATVVHLEDPLVASSSRLDASLYYEVASTHRERWQREPGRFGPEVAERIAVAMAVSGEDYLAARRWRAALRHAAERAFERCDVLVTPAVAALRKHIGVPTIRLGGDDVPYRSALGRFTAPVNHASLPALVLPLPADTRPPPSLQLIGPAWSESRLLEIGRALELSGICEAPAPPTWAR